MPSVIAQENFVPFAQELFDREEQTQKAAPILQGILESQISPRRCQDPRQRPIIRLSRGFLEEVDPKDVLLRLLDEEAPFFIADLIEIPRRRAKRTAYVGRLSDGKDPGLLLVARPC